MGTNYQPRIVTDGLVLCLDAADPKSYPSSGTVWYDRSGNKKNATTPSLPQFDGKSFNFNGNSNYFKIISPYDFSTDNALTIEIWAKSDNNLWNDTGFFASKRNQFVMHPQVSSRNVQYYYYASGWKQVTVIPDDITVWNQYVSTWNVGVISGYINGVFKTSQSVGGILSSDTGDLEIGHDEGYNTTRFMDGNISAARFYNRALSPEEVLQNYNATKGRFGL